jgi:hypothetical protein
MYFPDVVVGTGLVAVESDRVIFIKLVLPMNSWALYLILVGCWWRFTVLQFWFNQEEPIWNVVLSLFGFCLWYLILLWCQVLIWLYFCATGMSFMEATALRVLTRRLPCGSPRASLIGRAASTPGSMSSKRGCFTLNLENQMKHSTSCALAIFRVWKDYDLYLRTLFPWTEFPCYACIHFAYESYMDMVLI